MLFNGTSKSFNSEYHAYNITTITRNFNLSDYGISKIKAICVYHFLNGYGSYSYFDINNGDDTYTTYRVNYGSGSYGVHNWSVSNNVLTVTSGGYGGAASTNLCQQIVVVDGE